MSFKHFCMQGSGRWKGKSLALLYCGNFPIMTLVHHRVNRVSNQWYPSSLNNKDDLTDQVRFITYCLLLLTCFLLVVIVEHQLVHQSVGSSFLLGIVCQSCSQIQIRHRIQKHLYHVM